MEYVDNNAYEVKANPEAADYDMWGCCFIQLLSYGKPNQQHPERHSECVKLNIDFENLLNHVLFSEYRPRSRCPRATCVA